MKPVPPITAAALGSATRGAHNPPMPAVPATAIEGPAEALPAPVDRFGDELFYTHPRLQLAYLFFVFTPLMFWPDRPASAVWASLLAIALFVPAFLGFRGSQGRERIARTLLVAAIGLVLIPFNPGGNTFVIYAIGMLAWALAPRPAVWLSLLLVLVMAAEFVWISPRLDFALASVAVVVLIGGMILASVIFGRERARGLAELRLTQDEVRRLGALAERERIGRDLHDLLGHTLSLIALKSELAGKLFARDPAAAAREIDAVTEVARAALAQVREAVSGIRSTGLAGELAAARFALLSAEIKLDQRIAPLDLPTATEHALAMALREAVTNVIRHARARRVEVELIRATDGGIELCISDDGCGGIADFGNGLRGIRERLATIGGSLGLDSPREGGSRLRMQVPADAAAP